MAKIIAIIVLVLASSVSFASPRLLIVGDSLTASGGSYARELAKLYPTVIVAKSGQRTDWMLEHVRKMDLGQFTHLIVLGGGNDINQGRLRQAKANLFRIYGIAKSSRLRMIAITKSPWKGWRSWTPRKHQHTLQLNDWIVRQLGGLADDVVDFNALVRDANDPAQLAPVFGRRTDHLHPNRAAHRALAKEVMKKL